MAQFAALIFHVDYDEFKPETYRGVFALSDDGQMVDLVPSSGDMEADYKTIRERCSGLADVYVDDKSIDNFRTDRDTPPNLREPNLKRR